MTLTRFANTASVTSPHISGQPGARPQIHQPAPGAAPQPTHALLELRVGAPPTAPGPRGPVAEAGLALSALRCF